MWIQKCPHYNIFHLIDLPILHHLLDRLVDHLLQVGGQESLVGFPFAQQAGQAHAARAVLLHPAGVLLRIPGPRRRQEQVAQQVALRGDLLAQMAGGEGQPGIDPRIFLLST
jgi:hypothetical protein